MLIRWLQQLSPPGAAPKKGSSKSSSSTYKKFNVISVNCSQLCSVHASKRHELQQAQQAQLQRQHPHGTDDVDDLDDERKVGCGGGARVFRASHSRSCV